MRPFARLKIISLLCFLILLQFTLNSPAAAQTTNCDISLSTWTTGPNLPYIHLKGPSAFVNGKFYLIGGFKNSSLQVSDRVDVYNVATNTWETATTQRRPVPVAMSHGAAVVDGKFIWILGGFAGNNPGPTTNEVWKYDTEADLWYTAPALPQKRGAGNAVINGRNLHFFGGAGTKRDTNAGDHWVLNLDNPGAGWQTAPALPQPRMHFGSAIINGVIYAAGGQFSHDQNSIDQNMMHAFNIATGQWTQKANLAMPRSHTEGGTLAVNDKMLVIGGRANQSDFGNGQLKQASEYNPVTNTWRELTPMPGKLISPNGFFYNNKIYMTGGGSNWQTGNLKLYITQVSYINCSTNPTSTSAPATATQTSTPVPPTATNTGVPATETSTPEPSTATNTAVPVTATETSVPPTASNTGIPVTATETSTSVPPTATNTAAPVTETPTITPTPVYAISSLKFINADTDAVIGNMTSPYIINCATIGTSNLNIRALTNPSVVGSVRFGWDNNPNYVTENGPPYAIGQNSGSDYLPWTPANGQHTLTVTPFTGKNRTGEMGIPTIIQLTVSNCTGANQAGLTAPETAQLLQPQPEALVTAATLQFQWQAQPDATSYRLVIKREGKKKELASILLTPADICADGLCQINAAAFNPNLKAGRIYQWRIITRTEDGKMKSEKQTFRVQGDLLPLP